VLSSALNGKKWHKYEVRRVRGKTILALALALMFIGMTLTPRTFAAPTAKISVDPTDIAALMPGDAFEVDITVYNVIDLYTWAVELHYAPFASVIAVTAVVDPAGTPKEFLPNPKQGGVFDDFTFDVDHLEGIASIGYTLTKEYYDTGFSAPESTEVLCTVQFLVAEVGESDLSLQNTALYNSDGDWINHNTFGGFYHGHTVDLVPGSDLVTVTPGRSVNMKDYDMVTFGTTIHNFGTVPLMATVGIDIFGEDASFRSFQAGQTYNSVPPASEYFYVESFGPVYWDMWTQVGMDPWLDAPDDGNYVTDTTDGHLMGLWQVEDISLPPGREISDVIIEGYCDGPFDPGVDFDAYILYGGFNWVGSLYATGAPEWNTVRWTTDTVGASIPDMLTEAGFNSMMLVLYYYNPGGSPDPGIVDCVRFRVDYAQVSPFTAPVYTLAPGETLTVDLAAWSLLPMDIGRYYCTAYVEFSYGGGLWARGATEKDFHLRIFDSSH
jgi:hypothetical protein